MLWILRPAVFDSHVLALDKAGFAQALTECAQTAREHVRRFAAKISDRRHRRLLRARRERPCRRAAEQRDERAPFHQQFLSCFEAEDSTGGGLPHCGISKEPLSALGQQRPVDTLAAVAPCPLRSDCFTPCPLYPPKSGHQARRQECPLSCNKRHLHRSNSISTFARRSNDFGGCERRRMLAMLQTLTAAPTSN